MDDLRDEYDYEVEQMREWLTMVDLVPEMINFALVSIGVLGLTGLVIAALGS